MPEGTRTFTPGRWVGEASYPSTNIRPQRWYLEPDRTLGLERDAGGGAEFSIRSPQSHGKAAGEWMGAGCPGEHPTDQRLDDGGALLFETPPLREELSILGAARLRLELAADAAVAQLAVRISDVAPDGRATRVTYQVLNLTHRDSHEAPTALEPGRFYDIAVTLNAAGHRFVPGHRIRLAIASAYWPIVWPAPHAATLTVRSGKSVLELPVRHSDGPIVEFEPPAHGPLTPMSRVAPGLIRRFTTQDHVTGDTTYVTESEGGVFGEGVLRFDEIDTTIGHSLRRELTIRDDDPLSARYVLTQSYEMGREGWRTLVKTRSEMHSDAENFYLTGSVTAYESGTVVAERHWDEVIARDLM